MGGNNQHTAETSIRQTSDQETLRITTCRIGAVPDYKLIYVAFVPDPDHQRETTVPALTETSATVLEILREENILANFTQYQSPLLRDTLSFVPGGDNPLRIMVIRPPSAPDRLVRIVHRIIHSDLVPGENEAVHEAIQITFREIFRALTEMHPVTSQEIL